MKRKTILLLAWLLGGAGLACAQPQPDSPWPMLHHDQYHTGRSAYNGPETPTLKWVFATGCTTNAIISSPAIAADGTIYLPAMDGHLMRSIQMVQRNGDSFLPAVGVRQPSERVVPSLWKAGTGSFLSSIRTVL